MQYLPDARLFCRCGKRDRSTPLLIPQHLANLLPKPFSPNLHPIDFPSLSLRPNFCLASNTRDGVNQLTRALCLSASAYRAHPFASGPLRQYLVYLIKRKGRLLITIVATLSRIIADKPKLPPSDVLSGTPNPILFDFETS